MKNPKVVVLLALLSPVLIIVSPGSVALADTRCGTYSHSHWMGWEQDSHTDAYPYSGGWQIRDGHQTMGSGIDYHSWKTCSSYP